MLLNKIKHHLNKDSGLLKHASILFSATMIASIMNYLFQLFMGRALGPEQYGVLGALMSLMYIMSVPGGTIQVYVTKYVSKFSVKNQKIIGWIIRKNFKIVFVSGLIFLISFIFFSSSIASFLKIQNAEPVIALGFVLFLSLLNPVFLSALRGLQNFKGMGASNIINMTTKLIIGVLLVYLGFGVLGAVSGIGIGLIFGLIFSLILLRKNIFNCQKPKKEYKNGSYFWYVLSTMFLLVLFYNVDIIMVKIFFSSAQAGYYVAASTIAKIIFFISGPITSTMFPKASEIKEKGKGTFKILKHTLFYVAVLGVLLVIIYNIAPGFVVSTLYGSQYNSTIQLIGLFSIGMLFFSLINTVIQHNMAVENLSYLPLLLLGAIVEVLGILFFHSTLLDVVKVFTISMTFIFFLLLIIDKKEFIGS